MPAFPLLHIQAGSRALNGPDDRTYTAADIIDILGLQRHPEGGWFVETFVDSGATQGRAHSTAIYYLLEAGDVSAWHRVNDADEIWHHYQGDAVEQLQLRDDGEDRRGVVRLGQELEAGERPQILVPRGVWQGSRVLPGRHGYALCGTTMAPAFSFDGYEAGRRA